MDSNNQKRITISSAVILLALVVTVVYAAASGMISFQGSAFYNSKFGLMDLIITDEAIIDARLDDKVTILNNNQTLSFFINFVSPGETRIVQFFVKNNGNVAATLGNLNTKGPSPEPGALVYWPTLNNLIIMPGNTKGPFYITVSWNADYPAIQGIEHYSATLEFVQTVW